MNPGTRHHNTTWLVSAAHAAALIALVAAGSLHSCRKPRYVTMKVAMVALPSPAPVAPAPVTPAPPAQEEPVAPPTPTPEPPAQPTPRWQARSAEDIRRTALQPVERTVMPPSPTRPQIDAQAITRRLQQSVENVSVSVTPSPAREASRTDTAAMNRYLAVVSRQLHGAWQQPSASEAGGGQPVVWVSIQVQASGAVTAANITRTSGSVAMDGSVKQLLAGLRNLPPLRDYGLRERQLTISIAFELD